MMFSKQVLERFVVRQNGEVSTEPILVKFGDSKNNGKSFFVQLALTALSSCQSMRGVSNRLLDEKVLP